ncbi:MAG: LysM peptidoglycan-binding domain-containing protein [Planctomycetota bacterium]
MGIGTKIAMVLVLVLVVVVIANLLNQEVEKAPSGKEQAPKFSGEASKSGVSPVSSPRKGSPVTPVRDRGKAGRAPFDLKPRADTQQGGERKANDARSAEERRKQSSPARSTPLRGGEREQRGSGALRPASDPNGVAGRSAPKGGWVPPQGSSPGGKEAARGSVVPAVTGSPSGEGRITKTGAPGETSRKSAAPANGGRPASGRELARRTGPPSSRESKESARGRGAPLRSPEGKRYPFTHEVGTGDTLWDLAERFYGKPTLFPLIEKANPALEGGATLKIGMKLTIPTPPAGATKASPAKETLKKRAGFVAYRIREGDTLYDIAEARLGDAQRWTEIARANPDLDPARLRVGGAIFIPEN